MTTATATTEINTDFSKLEDFEKFVEVQKGVWRVTIGFSIIPIACFLIQGTDATTHELTNDWIMIDAGAPPQGPKLLKAISEVLKNEKDRISHLMITHAHMDHVGCVDAIMDRYPECQVVCHPEEKPFICDGKTMRSVQGDSWLFNIMKYQNLKPTCKVPIEKTIVLEEKQAWKYGHLVQLISTPGHTPGSASFLHIPSKSLMAGDALMFTKFFAKLPTVRGPIPMGTCCMGNALKAIEKIVSLEAEIDVVLPAHDYSHRGLTMAEVRTIDTTH